MLYAHEAYHLRPNSPWAVASMVWGLFSITMGVVFIALQGSLYWYGHLVLEDEEHDREHDVERDVEPMATPEPKMKDPVESGLIMPSIAEQLSTVLSDPDIECDVESMRQSHIGITGFKSCNELSNEDAQVPPLTARRVSLLVQIQTMAHRILARKLQYVRVTSV